MSLIPTWPFVAGALVVGLLGGAYADHTVMAGRIAKTATAHAEELRQREVVRAADEAKARNNERQMAEAVGLAEQEKTNAIDRIRSDSAAAIARLQQRPDRKPAAAGGLPAPTPACAGSTGAELSRPDAGFLNWEAARANEQREALRACYGWADAVEKRPGR